MNRRGMSLIEMLATMTILGIVVNIAIPTYPAVRRRADAARVIGAFTAVRVAAYDNFAKSGSFPANGQWARVPREFAPSLGVGFEFQYKTVSYRWRRWSLPNGLPRRRNQTVLLGLEIRTNDQDLMVVIKGLYKGRMAFGNATHVTLVIE